MRETVLELGSTSDFHLCVKWNLQANLLVSRIHQSLCKAAVKILVVAAQVFQGGQGEDKVGIILA